MHELGAVAEAEWTHYNIYDPVHGELLEQYLNWRRPDGDLAGRIEEYYAHGETFELYVIFDDEHPDTAHRPR